VEQVESYCEDKGDNDELLLQEKYVNEYIDDESLFLDELFKDECNHSSERTYVEDLKFRVPFEKRKLDLSIVTFDEPTNDQTFENIIQEPRIDQSFQNLFEDELIIWMNRLGMLW